MPRVKRGVTARARHKKVIDQAKGFRGRRGNVYRVAKEAVMKAGQYAYRDRRQRKREFRALWIARINAAARELGLTYSKLMQGLKKAAVEVDRKLLAELAIADKAAFARIAAVSARRSADPVGVHERNHGESKDAAIRAVDWNWQSPYSEPAKFRRVESTYRSASRRNRRSHYRSLIVSQQRDGRNISETQRRCQGKYLRLTAIRKKSRK